MHLDYAFFISGRGKAISNLYEERILYPGGVKQTRFIAMTDFAPQRCLPHHFDIRHDHRGRWVARDRDGLTGGTFLTHRDALRFALCETGGDAAYVHDAKGVSRGGGLS